MTDTFTKTERSRIMAAVKSKNTTPEIAVRRLVHSMGHRYRLHVRALPGCPDLVFPKCKKVIFVHGCFWHRHRCRKGRSMPSTRVRFWRKKLQGNRERDLRQRKELRRLGWKVLVVWECQTVGRNLDLLVRRIADFLGEF